MDFHERISLDYRPSFTIPLGQSPGLSLAKKLFLVISIVGNNNPSLSSISAFEMLLGIYDFQLFNQIEQELCLKAIYVNLPEAALHTKEIDFIFLVGQMAHSGGQTIVLKRFNCSYVSIGIDGVRADERLP